MNPRPYLISWSGGKDSALALHRARAQWGPPRAFFTMMTEGGARSRSHGLARSVLAAQAEAVGCPLWTKSASWSDYERVFTEAMRDARSDGIEAVVFGDIDIDENRAWCERVCRSAGLAPYHPLWQAPRRELLAELLRDGFTARILAVRDGVLPPELLDRTIDERLVADLEGRGVDASGENGEYHTVVTAGPIFRHAVEIRSGERVLRSGVHFLDVERA